jgi:prefoldin subunit 5
MNEQAAREYYQTIRKIDQEIEALKSQISEYNQVHNSINWANVGDMKYILAQLKQLNGEEE